MCTGVRAGSASGKSQAIEMQSSSCRVATTREGRCTEPSYRHKRRRLSGPGSPDVDVVVGNTFTEIIVLYATTTAALYHQTATCD